LDAPTNNPLKAERALLRATLAAGARRRLFAAMAVGVVLSTRPPNVAGAADHVVRVDATRILGSANRNLAGAGWNTGSLSAIRPFAPPIVRVDGHLDRVSLRPGAIDLADVLEHVTEVHDAGGAPLVILFPMPRWLGEGSLASCVPSPLAPTCDATKLPPSDFDAWEALIRDVVRELATADPPARRFEVWNEPDIPVFWQGTRDEFLATALATHRAISDVVDETGIAIEVGGPGSAAAAGLIGPYAEAVAAAGLPLDFVSWHRYGNIPNLGPDGNEGLIDEDLYRLLAGVNPNTTPRDYGREVGEVQQVVADALAAARPDGATGTGSGDEPILLLDEWNLSSGGYDRRHDTNEGAAFALGVLIELERAGLDGAAYYRSVSGSAHVGDWGLVTPSGGRKPTWWVLDLWSRMAGRRIAVEGDDPATGLWARAVAGSGHVEVLLATFVATGGSATTVQLDVAGCDAASAEVATIDAASPSFADGETRAVASGTLDLALADQSATWVRLACERPDGTRPRRPRLPTLRRTTPP